MSAARGRRIMAARALLLAALALPAQALTARLHLLATWESSAPAGTEMVRYQAATKRLAVGNGEAGWIKILSLQDPARPRLLQTLAGFAAGRTLAAVDFHPMRDAVAVALADPGGGPGEILVLSAADGAALARYAAGHGPDDVRFSPDGRYLAAANEAAEYRRTKEGYASHPGSITLVDLEQGFDRGIVRQIPLAQPHAGHGLTARGAMRALAREVDGAAVAIPLDSGDPAHLEPESLAFSPDGGRSTRRCRKTTASS